MTEPTPVHPVYVDGPLKGKDFPVTAGTRYVQAIDPDAPWDGDLDDRIATYYLRKFVFCSGGTSAGIWMGVSSGEPPAEVLAELLLSDAAKAARIEAS